MMITRPNGEISMEMEIDNKELKWEKPELTVISVGDVAESVLSISQPPPPPGGYPGNPGNP